MNQRREWLVDQIMARTVKAATSPDHRAADDDFCAHVPLREYCRRIAALAITELQVRGHRDALNLELAQAAEYLDRVLELEIKRARNGQGAT